MGQTSNYSFDGSGAAPNAARRVVQATYDVSKMGGGTATYNLIKLNQGCRVIGGYVDISGTPTAASGTPTLAIQVQSANDLITAASVLGAPWSTVQKTGITPKANTPESTSITLTADRNVAAVVAAAPLSAGIVSIFLEVIG